MNPKVYFKALADALKKGHDYGKNKKSRGRKLLLEFVSANPTGPLNVVSARAAVLGDSIANLLTASGTEVLREYYINDTGGQARLFGESLLAACDRLQGKNTQAPPEGYQGAYMEDLAKEYSGLSPAPEPSQWGMDRMVQWHQRSLAAYGVSFDRWFSEKKELHDSGVVDQTVTRLKGAGLTFEQAGALWIKTSEYGSPKDEVIVKSNGVPAYFVADIAYHLNKLERGYQQIVNIMGPDHHGHILRMKAAHRALGYPPESFMVLIAQQVNLLEGREKVKMSKREGKFVTMDELLQKVGQDAARFFFVMRSPNSHLDFDIEVALKQTDENPVYYVQYAHARICSLLRKAREAGLEPALQAEAMEPLLEGEELLLLKEMLEYPQWVEESGLAFEPHRIVAYLQKLAGDFHVFYSKCRMIGEAPELAQARLSLALGTKTVIRNALGLLGVSAPEQM
jgi:arginyl-tRNA synthetase